MADSDNSMGIEAVTPKNENGQDDDNEGQENNEELDESINAEEYDLLDAKLDDLNSVLDMIEQKNDKIRDEFLKLLHSNKQIREELQQENGKKDNENKDITEESS